MSAWLEDQLAFIRERRRQYLLSFLWLIPGLLGILFGEIFHSNWLGVVAIVAALVVILVFNIRCEFTCQCPRCGNLFFRMGVFYNTFSSKCIHCGLSLNNQPPGDGRAS